MNTITLTELRKKITSDNWNEILDLIAIAQKALAERGEDALTDRFKAMAERCGEGDRLKFWVDLEKSNANEWGSIRIK